MLTKTNSGAMKFVSIILCLMILVTSFPLYSASAANISAKTTDNVNLRTGAGTNHSVIQVVTTGTSLTVTDDSNSTWYKVSLSNGTSGYMHSDYIQLASSTTSEAGVTTDNVNLRTGKSTSTTVIKVVPTGTSLTILDKSDSTWYKVKVSTGEEGYMHSNYISVGSSATTTPTTAPSTSAVSKGVTTNTVNLRSGGSISDSLISVVSAGVSVSILDNSGTYFKVEVATGETGYMHSNYIKITETGVTATPKPSATATPAPSTGGTGLGETTGTVNLRTWKSTSYPILTVCAPGTKLTILNTSDKTWYEVKVPTGEIGYMHSSYIKVTQEATATPAPTASPTATPKPTATPTPTQTPSSTGQALGETTDTVNLRTWKSTSYPILTICAPGTKLTILDRSDSTWYQVKVPTGEVGYMHSSYIKITQELTATPTPTPVPTSTPTPTPIPPKPTATPAPGSTVAYTTDAVNFRTGAGTSHSIISTLKAGTMVTVLDTSNSSWYKVQLADGTQGYVHTNYLYISPTGSATPAPTATPTQSPDSNTGTTDTYYKITADALNVRDAASTSGGIITQVGFGKIVTLIEKTSDDWFKIKTDSGIVGYVASAYLTPYTSSSGSGVSLSTSSASVPQYKSIYIKASGASGYTWTSSNDSIASVNSGYIYANSPGTATITAKDSFGNSTSSVTITVTAPENIRFAYPEENAAVANEAFNLVAVTDTAKTEVRFEVNGQTLTSGVVSTETQSTEGFVDNTINIFKASVTLPEGSHTVKVYSKTGSTYSTTPYEFTVIVGATSGASNVQRQVSSEMISLLGSFEGFVKTVYSDDLAGGIPTLGYGYVLYANETFYNNLTPTEGLAMLVDTVSQEEYTKDVNSMIKNNNFAATQAQFDAMVSFAYNVGTAWTTDSTVKDVMKTAVNYSSLNLSATSPQYGTVIRTSSVYADSNNGAVTSTLSQGATVTVTGYVTHSNGETWYQINEGWIRAGYVSLTNYVNSVKDLTYVDAGAFSFRLLEWHVAGGECLAGLLYRRLAEAKIFLYGNYAEADKSNANYKINTYNFPYPSCMAQYQ